MQDALVSCSPLARSFKSILNSSGKVKSARKRERKPRNSSSKNSSPAVHRSHQQLQGGTIPPPSTSCRAELSNHMDQSTTTTTIMLPAQQGSPRVSEAAAVVSCPARRSQNRPASTPTTRKRMKSCVLSVWNRLVRIDLHTARESVS